MSGDYIIPQGRSEQDSTYEPSERTMAGGGKAVAAADGCVVVRDVKKEMRKGLKTKYATANLPRHYRGYEALLEEDTAPTPPVPSGTTPYMYTYMCSTVVCTCTLYMYILVHCIYMYMCKHV